VSAIAASRAATGLRGWALWSLPRGARVFVLSVEALYVIALVVGLITTGYRPEHITTLLILLGCALISVEASLRLVWRGPRPGRAVRDMLGVWTVAMALLLPPVYGALLVVPLLIFFHFRVAKRPPVKLAYTAASAGLAVFVASSLHELIAPSRTMRWNVHTLIGSPMAVLATAVCVFARFAVNTGLIAQVVAMTSPGARVRDSFNDPDVWGVVAAESCTGILLALACLASPYAVLLAVPPVLVLQRALLLAEYREAARTDGKTGLANSSYWREVAEREITRARGGAEDLAVLLVDIDHFKLVNDRYGHLTGDQVLRAVADGLTQGLRPRDLVGRFGGEEFVIMLAGSDLEQARHTAERLRVHVSEISVEASARPELVQVTVSVGVAAFRHSGLSVHELLDAADTALYAAKHAGRNCVRVAEGSRQQVLDLSDPPRRILDLRARSQRVD
jgi:diguanylate cyclase (GGDEF)-like protein